MAEEQKSITAYSRFRTLLQRQDVVERFEGLIQKRAPEYLSALLALVSTNEKLLQCDYTSILQAASKAAILHLPIDNELGYGYIIPYGNKATFITGYKGMVQLALRTKQYEKIHADCVYEGEIVEIDRMSGAVKITGNPTSGKVIGYFAYFKLKNGFEKTVYWTVEQVIAHATMYSQGYQYAVANKQKDSPWIKSPHEMGKKTVLRYLLRRWGLMSIEMADDDIPFVNPDNDPRIAEPGIAVPDFSDVVDGEAHDVDPEPTPAPEIEPPTDTEPQQPADVFAECVEAGYFANIHEAKNAFKRCKTGYNTPDKALAWAKAYRAFRDQDMHPEKAAYEANQGKMPL